MAMHIENYKIWLSGRKNRPLPCSKVLHQVCWHSATRAPTAIGVVMMCVLSSRPGLRGQFVSAVCRHLVVHMCRVKRHSSSSCHHLEDTHLSYSATSVAQTIHSHAVNQNVNLYTQVEILADFIKVLRGC